MKNNQPQLHVASTLIAQESITLNVISMNTERIHTRWLGLVRGAGSRSGRVAGGLVPARRSSRCPWQLGSDARTGDPTADPGGEGAIGQ